MALRQLERKCRRVRTRTGQQVNVLDVGRKRDPVILFLHGFGGAWQGWRSQIDFFGKQGFRVIAPDLNGHGATAFRPHSTILNYGEDILDVLEKLGVRRPVHVVAHSYGGPIALTMAQMNAEKNRLPIASLSFINSFAKHPVALKWAASVGAWLYRAGEGRLSRKELTDKAQVVESIEDVHNRAPGRPRFYNVPSASENPGVAQKVIDYVMKKHVYVNSVLQTEDEKTFPKATPDGMIDLYNAARNFFVQDVLELPALVIHSRRDRIIPYWGSKLQLAWCFKPHAKGLRLATFSHVPHREFPDRINEALLQHMRAASHDAAN